MVRTLWVKQKDTKRQFCFLARPIISDYNSGILFHIMVLLRMLNLALMGRSEMRESFFTRNVSNVLLAIAFVLSFMLFSFQAWAEEGEEGGGNEPQYVELSPAFVANFGTSSGKLKYVKTEVTLRVPSEEAMAIVEANNPLVRHYIVMLLSRQTPETIHDQEAIRKEALKNIQEAIKEETGSKQVTDLLFTTYVVQG